MIPANGGESNTPGRVSPSSSPDDTPAGLTALVAALVAPRTVVRPIRPEVERGKGSPGALPGRPRKPESIARRIIDGDPMVAQLRPDVVTLDLDGCATRAVITELGTIADKHGARLAYRAASGSRASEHHAYAVPSAARGEFVAAVENLRKDWGYNGTDQPREQDGKRPKVIEIREGDGGGVRLPWSAPIKSGGRPVQPLHPDTGVAVDPWECLDALETALEAAGLPKCHPGLPRRSTRRTTAPTAPTVEELRPAALDTMDALEVEERDAGTGAAALRAARRGTTARPDGLASLEPGERAALECSPPVGQRSDAALRAGRVLWAHGYRDWADAAPLVEKYPAFEKLRECGGKWARDWWARESARWAAYTPELSAGDRERIESWREVGRFMSPALDSALHGVLEVMEQRGSVTACPVAVRDVVVVGGAASTRSAWRRLTELVDAGVLEVSREWADGPADESTRYTLSEPGKWKESTQWFTRPPACAPACSLSPLHPVWLALGATARRVLEHLTGGEPWTVTGLSTATGFSRPTVRAHVREMERVGLVVAVGRRWAVAPVLDLDGAGERVDAVGAHTRRVSLVEVERDLWRAETRDEQAIAARDLETARAGVRADAERRRPVEVEGVEPVEGVEVEGVERVERVEVEGDADAVARAVVAGDPLRGWPVGVEVSMFGAAAVAGGGGAAGGAPPGWFADGGGRSRWGA